MVSLLFVVSPIVCWGCGFEPCFVMLFLVSFLRKSEHVVLLSFYINFAVV